MDRDVLAVIPARGGSKRIRRKNLREVDNTSLLVHAIDDAERASLIDEVVVSNDDEEIRHAARRYGEYASFERLAR